MQSAIKDNPCILVEGPRWGDAEFYGQWLLATAKAQRLYDEAMKDPVFADETFLLTWEYRFDLGINALNMLRKLFDGVVAAVIEVTDESAVANEGFRVLAALGFLVLTGNRYQMAIPKHLDLETLKRALIKLAAEDDDDVDNPLTAGMPRDETGMIPLKDLLVTMPRADAERWHDRLVDMHMADVYDRQRLADRNILLE
jgi:hypothetical protein